MRSSRVRNCPIRSSARASSTPSTGAHTIATRPSITDSNSGSLPITHHGPGSMTPVYGTGTCGPRDSSSATAPVIASARTAGRRHSHTQTAAPKASRGQP